MFAPKEQRLRSIFFSASILITAFCTLCSTWTPSADKGGRGTLGVDGLDLDDEADNEDGVEEARREHQMSSWRTRSASGRSQSMCL